MVVRKSLTLRIISLSAIWIFFTLFITALLLTYFYRDHISQHFDEHVEMHLEEIVEASIILPDGTYEMTSVPSDPRFHDLYSGWHWEVRQAGTTLKKSESLGGNRLNLGHIEPATSTVVHEIAGPKNETLRVHVIEISLDPNREPVMFLASAPTAGITDDVADYFNHILTSFLLLGVGLLLAVMLQVRIALKPLQAISTGISDIREGKLTKLPQDNPEEVQLLVDELNILLEHNAVLLKRARFQLGDLAHAVKNPLTVINNESRNLTAEHRALILQQTAEINKNVDHYLSRARAFGTHKVLGSRSNVKTVVEDLVYAMQRIYQGTNLEYEYSRLKSCWFMGEAQDLEEMVGNLMDNACKWAHKQVVVRCEIDNNRLILMVEDDGPGISEENYSAVMHRGHKLDPSKPGHGQGLGIVQDIAHLYGGTLELGRSQLGGLQVKLNLPATRPPKTA